MEKVSPAATAFYQRLLEKVGAIPGVESAALIGAIPTRCCAEEYTFSILGHALPPPENRPVTGYSEASAGIFDTMKIPLLKGRYLSEHDTLAAPWAIVVNETFVHKFFPNEDPIGQQILLRYDPYPVDQDRPRQIVGVVGDVKHFGPGEETPPFVYAPYLQQAEVFPGGATRAHLHQGLMLRTPPGLVKRWRGADYGGQEGCGGDRPGRTSDARDEHGRCARGVDRGFAILYACARTVCGRGSDTGGGGNLRGDVVLGERACA